MRVGFKESKQFLDDFKPSDDVCLIFHDDLDGIASGVLLYNWCESKGLENIKTKIFCSKGYKGDEHKDCNKIIVADIFPSGFDMLSFTREQEVLYLDHHPQGSKFLLPNILEYRTINEGYIPSSRTIQELTELKKWVGVCGVLGDSGELYPENEEYLSSFFRERGITMGEFKAGVSNVLSNCLSYFKEDLISFFNILKDKEVPEDCDDLREYSEIVEANIQKGFNYYLDNKVKIGKVNYCFMNSSFKSVGVAVGMISRKFPEEIFMSVKPSDEEGKVLMSMRVQRDDYDLNVFIKKVVEGIDGASAGGHPRAIGGSFFRKDLPLIKKRIEELSLEMFK